MSGKRRLCLLDAGPVIGLHELGLWSGVCKRTEIVVPSVVADKEVIFYPEGEGTGRPIDLRSEAVAGVLRITAAEAGAVSSVLRLFDPVMRERIDAGEAEALALLNTWEGDLPEFCSADGAAVRAACLLGFADQIVSLEAVLRRTGLTPSKLAAKYTERKLLGWVRDGRQMLLRGEGLAR